MTTTGLFPGRELRSRQVGRDSGAHFIKNKLGIFLVSGCYGRTDTSTSQVIEQSCFQFLENFQPELSNYFHKNHNSGYHQHDTGWFVETMLVD